MIIDFFKNKNLIFNALFSSGMVFMFIPRCSPPRPHVLDVEMIESFKRVNEEDLSPKEESLLGTTIVESEIRVSEKE